MNSEKPLVRTGALQLATSLMPRRTLSHLEGFRKAFRAGGAMDQKAIESRSQCRDICRRSRVTQDLRVEHRSHEAFRGLFRDDRLDLLGDSVRIAVNGNRRHLLG